MLKTAATYATFLLIVSVLYYVPFWWAFNIDVLPFFEPQDFLLGIIFPLRYSGTYFLSLLIPMIIFTSIVPPKRFASRLPDYRGIDGLLDEIKAKEGKLSNDEILNIKRKLIDFKNRSRANNKTSHLMNKISAILSLSIAYFAFKYLMANPYGKTESGFAATLIAFAIYQTLEAAYEVPLNLLGLSDENLNWIPLIDFILTVLLIFLPVSAVITSYSESQAILQGKRFRYVMAQDLPDVKFPSNQKYIVYLGAVNSKLILTDSTNSVGIVIDKEKIPVLRVHYFDYTDKISVYRFEKLMRNTKVLSEKRIVDSTNILAPQVTTKSNQE